MGLTNAGYTRRTYDDILNDKIQRAKELFGEDIDTSDLTPLGKFIRINAYDQALAEEEIEAVYYSRFPNTATGQSLDRLAVFGCLTRNPAEAASYTVEIQGTAGHNVPLGFLVGTDTELTFYTVEEATINDSGSCLVTVDCTEAGTVGNVSPGSITKIVNPDANIAEVLGQACVSVGTDEESDADFRVRLKAALAGAGSGNANAIRAAVLRVPGVRHAEVIENDSNAEDSEGRPPHSFECYVVGGSGNEQEIAKAIFSKKALGIIMVGDNEVTITDEGGYEKVVRYSSAENVQVTVRISLKTSSSFPADGTTQVADNVAGYINSLGIGASLVYSSLYGYIYKVPGVTEVTVLELSTDGGSSYGTSNISVPKYGIATCAGVTAEVVS